MNNENIREHIERQIRICKDMKQLDVDIVIKNNAERHLDFYETIDKEHKALEIIKEKDVNPIDIRCCETVEQYNVKENGFIRLTKEEFNLLKEVLS